MNERDDSELEARLRALPRSLEPGQDLWSGIAARVDAAKRAQAQARTAARARRASRVRWLGGGTLAAAASVALVLGSMSRLHHRVVGSVNVAPSGSMAAVVSSAPPASTPLPGAPRGPIIPEEASYRAALADLGTSFMQNRGNLPPASAKAIDDNVRTLEQAVEATRAALAADPGNQELRSQLRDEYQQEIDVLQDVIDLSTRT